MGDKYKSLIIFLFLIIFPYKTLQQGKNGYFKETIQTDDKQEANPIFNLKTIAVITSGVLLLGIVFYGKKCYYLCQMTICSGAERHYMDLASQV